jgi:hypothetical protein
MLSHTRAGLAQIVGGSVGVGDGSGVSRSWGSGVFFWQLDSGTASALFWQLECGTANAFSLGSWIVALPYVALC